MRFPVHLRTWAFGYFLVVLLGCVTSCDRSASKSPGPRFTAAGGPSTSDRYALLVGIGHYPGGIGDLSGPPQDVEAMRSLLVDRFGFPRGNVVALTDSTATRSRIIGLIQSHLGKGSSQGAVVLYFSGHGLALDSNYSVQDSEATGGDQALYVWADDGKGASIILDDELNYLLRSLTSNRVLVIADACFSGTIIRMLGTSPGKGRTSARAARFADESLSLDDVKSSIEMPTHFITDSGSPNEDVSKIVLLSATTEGAPAYTGTDWPSRGLSRGVFSYYLQHALTGASPSTTLRELTDHVRITLAHGDPCAVNLACQTPQILGGLADSSVGAFLGPR